MKRALVLIDIQNDYFPGGRNELFAPEQAAQSASRALLRFRQNGWPVCHVQHVSTGDTATFFLPGTPGMEIYKAVAPQGGEPVFIKHAPNAFFETGLLQALQERGIRELVVCGMMTHMCVDTSVRAARDHGLQVTLLHDACATGDLVWKGKTVPAQAVHAAYMAALDGSFARVVSTEEFLQELAR
ncbi:MAG TPA: cysteine hydrolase family protein [Feifaniaceae bacterium]|nr:cysteine hydrolase family protein [Feifaniaceae bacterium]